MKFLAIFFFLSSTGVAAYADYCSPNHEFIIQVDAFSNLMLVKHNRGTEPVPLIRESERFFAGYGGYYAYQFNLNGTATNGQLKIGDPGPPRGGEYYFDEAVEMKLCDH